MFEIFPMVRWVLSSVENNLSGTKFLYFMMLEYYKSYTISYPWLIRSDLRSVVFLSVVIINLANFPFSLRKIINMSCLDNHDFTILVIVVASLLEPI